MGEDETQGTDESIPNKGPSGDKGLTGEELRLFEKLFEERFGAVKLFFSRQGCSEEDSRDLTQEVFIAAYKGLPGFRFECEPTTWLLRIARHRLLNFVRSNNSGKRRQPEGIPDEEDGIEPPDPSGRTPESEILSAEEIRQIEFAVSSLPTKMRTCLELRMSGLEYHEIAERMGLSIDTIKSHLHQARARLRPQTGSGSGRGNAS